MSLDIGETFAILMSRANPDTEGCLIYTFGKDIGRGYGQFNVARPKAWRGDGRTARPWGKTAHRASWFLQKGPIPEGLDVLHHCDKRRCIKLECLFLGTNADNTADMIAKGRQVTKPAKINYDIIERWLAGESSADLAIEVGCHRNAISYAYRHRYLRRVKHVSA